MDSEHIEVKSVELSATRTVRGQRIANVGVEADIREVEKVARLSIHLAGR
jgi:hypothetical protein